MSPPLAAAEGRVEHLIKLLNAFIHRFMPPRNAPGSGRLVPCIGKDVTMSPNEIRQLRDDLGLSQRDLAEILGVSHVAVGHWERGDARPPETRVAMMEKLRERANSEGQEFVEGLVALAGTAAMIGILNHLFGAER